MIVERIWRETLRVDAEVSLHQGTFFEQGGTSLQAVALAARLQLQFGVELTALSVHDHPTPRQLAGHIEASQAATPEDEDEEGML